jgi:hypothetical protein
MLTDGVNKKYIKKKGRKEGRVFFFFFLYLFIFYLFMSLRFTPQIKQN